LVCPQISLIPGSGRAPTLQGAGQHVAGLHQLFKNFLESVAAVLGIGKVQVSKGDGCQTENDVREAYKEGLKEGALAERQSLRAYRLPLFGSCAGMAHPWRPSQTN